MQKARLEAFSDGVLAILITIMVLELKVPHGVDLHALKPMVPAFLGYVLSFVYLGIYWTNHHHLLHATRRINGVILWANLHLLFWLSLIPVATAWVGEHPREEVPTALYGVILLMAGVAWLILERALIAENGRDSMLARAVGHEGKLWVSMVIYVAAVPLAFIWTWASDALYVAVALMWFLPNPQIERMERPSRSAPPPKED